MRDYKSASTARLPAQAEDRRVRSWMWEHTRDAHGGVVGDQEGKADYKVAVSGKFIKSLYRQVNEDARMQQFEQEGGDLLNNKQEYYTPKSVQPIFRQL